MTTETTASHPAPEAGQHYRYYFLAVLLGMALLLWTLAAENPWGWLLPERVAVEVDQQVYLVPESELKRLARTPPAWLSEAEAQALVRFEQGMSAELDALFQRVHERVPDVADWYYSAPGVGVRTLAAIPFLNDWLPEATIERLFPDETWQAEMDALDRDVSARYSAEFSAVERQWLAWLAREWAPYRRDAPLPQDQRAIDLNERLEAHLAGALAPDRIALQMGAGLGAGALLARGALARVNARVAAGRAAARLASRGTAVSGTAACGLSGPMAIACGVAVFTTTTLATEWALLRADEALNRPDLETALHGSVDALRATMTDEYARQFLTSLEVNLDALSAGIQGSLRPIDRIRAAR